MSRSTGSSKEHGFPAGTEDGQRHAVLCTFCISACLGLWVKLGIKRERIQRGKPTQTAGMNASTEREKADAIRAAVARRSHPAATGFDGFRHEYNTERPHEALDYRVPASAYVASKKLSGEAVFAGVLERPGRGSELSWYSGCVRVCPISPWPSTSDPFDCPGIYGAPRSGLAPVADRIPLRFDECPLDYRNHIIYSAAGQGGRDTRLVAKE